MKGGFIHTIKHSCRHRKKTDTDTHMHTHVICHLAHLYLVLLIGQLYKEVMWSYQLVLEDLLL